MFKKTFEKFFGSQTPAEVLSVPSAARNALKPRRSKELKQLESDIEKLGTLVGISVAKDNTAENESKASKNKKSDEQKTGNNDNSSNSGAAKTKFWGKGTGYGHSSSQYKWDVNSYQNASSDAPVAKLCATIQQRIPEALRTTDAQTVSRSLQNSCLMPFLSHHCRNDSLVDMERHRNLYEAVFNLLAALCDAPSTARLFLFSYHTSSGAIKGDMSDAAHYHKSLYGTVKKLKKHAEFVESKQEALVARLKAAESAADANLPASQPHLENTDSKPAPTKVPAKKTGVVKVKDSEDGTSFTALLLKTAKQVEESVSRLQSVACQPITSPRKKSPLLATRHGEEKMEVLELPQMIVDEKPIESSATTLPIATPTDSASATTIINIPPLTMPPSPVHSSGDMAPASPSGFSIGGVDGPLSPVQSASTTASPASTPAPGPVSPATITVSVPAVAASTIPVAAPAIPIAPTAPTFAATGGDDDDILGNFFDESPAGTYTALSKPKSVAAAVETKNESDSLFTDAERAAWEEEKKVRAKISYEKTLEDLRFQEIAEFPIHHYKGQSSGEVTRMFVRRVASEFIDLSSSLPINAESSVFMRVHESNTTLVQFMVTAPTGTPYGGGCFLFDVMLPSSYPNQPPKVNLQTTGKGSVRFNPNLYNCGKVCLSLLGTWGGQSGETWIAGTSTLLQVMVSIQSLIFVPHPYFNEPGYERQMGTPNGDKQSDNYNKNIEQQTVRWGMIDMLRNPPAGFEDVVRRHFYLRQDAIMEQVQEWLKQPGRSGLQALAKELKEELKKLDNPLASTQ